MKRTIVLSLLVAMAIATSACGLVGATAPPATATLVAAPPEIQPVVPAPILPPPLPTPVPPTAAPTPSLPRFTPYVGLNCRSGPSTDYRIISGIVAGQSVPIIARTDMPDLSTWWLLGQGAIPCWASGSFGYASGDLSGVPLIPAPTLPHMWNWERHEETVKVSVLNSTGGQICKLVFYHHGRVVASFPWERREFRDGNSKKIWVEPGFYDLVKAYDCKASPRLSGSATDVDIDSNGSSFEVTP